MALLRESGSSPVYLLVGVILMFAVVILLLMADVDERIGIRYAGVDYACRSWCETQYPVDALSGNTSADEARSFIGQLNACYIGCEYRAR